MTPAEKKEPSAQANESRQRIIVSAVKLFADYGFAATGTRVIATKAGVNMAMIHYFFGSKKGLLKEILDIFFCGYIQVAQKHLQGSGSAEKKLEAFIQAAIMYFSEQRDYLIVVITELPHDDPDVIEHKASWGQQMMKIINNEICLPLTGNTLSPMFVGQALTSLMSSHFLFEPIRNKLVVESNKSLLIDDYASQITKLFLSGILIFREADDESNK